MVQIEGKANFAVGTWEQRHRMRILIAGVDVCRCGRVAQVTILYMALFILTFFSSNFKFFHHIDFFYTYNFFLLYRFNFFKLF